MNRYWKRLYSLFIILLLVCSMLTACTGEKIKKYQKDVFALNTWLSFTVYGDRNGERIIDTAIERVREIENRMSITIEDSDVSRINSNAGKKPVKVNNDTLEVIEKGLEYGRISHGAFDITIYPIVKLWGITSEHPKVPTEKEVQDKLSLVNYGGVIVDGHNNTVYLKKEGMGIDLGAIAKGYAADEIVRVLKEGGIQHALINMGGNVIVIGGKPDGKPWRIGIQDPRAEEGHKSHIAIVEIMDGSVVSSGDYERYIVEVYNKTGVRYHHIFDPNTGYPADQGLMGTTVIAEHSIDADALSTAVFVMGIHEGFQIIDQMENVKALTITKNKEIYTSQGFGEGFILTDKEYKIVP